MMNYYYEQEDLIEIEGFTVSEWYICNPQGERIAKATTEENANLIVTLMNGDHSGK